MNRNKDDILRELNDSVKIINGRVRYDGYGYTVDILNERFYADTLKATRNYIKKQLKEVK